jgi:hypothetical protein
MKRNAKRELVSQKARTPSTRRAPGGKVRLAIEAMVWQGHHRDEAAKLAGIKPKSLYNAFRKPHVKAFYNAELGVLRESGRAKVFHRLEALAAQDQNKAAAVKACQVLEQIDDEAVKRPAAQLVPGLVVIIGSPPSRSIPSAPVVIDAKAEPEPEPEPDDDTITAPSRR